MAEVSADFSNGHVAINLFVDGHRMTPASLPCCPNCYDALHFVGELDGSVRYECPDCGTVAAWDAAGKAVSK